MKVNHALTVSFNVRDNDSNFLKLYVISFYNCKRLEYQLITKYSQYVQQKYFTKNVEFL